MPVHSRIELEFGNVGFRSEGKIGVPGEKPLGAENLTNNKLNPHMTPGHIGVRRALSPLHYLCHEPITRSVQLPYSLCETAFSQVGLFLDKPSPRIGFQ